MSMTKMEMVNLNPMRFYYGEYQVMTKQPTTKLTIYLQHLMMIMIIGCHSKRFQIIMIHLQVVKRLIMETSCKTLNVLRMNSEKSLFYKIFKIFLSFPNRIYNISILYHQFKLVGWYCHLHYNRNTSKLVENIKFKFINICTNSFLIFVCFLTKILLCKSLSSAIYNSSAII